MIIMQLTDRHPLSNCPQLLQPTRSPELVRRSNLNCNCTIWSNIWPRCNYQTRDYSCFFYLTATYRTRWRHRRASTFTSWCSSIQPQVQIRYRRQTKILHTNVSSFLLSNILQARLHLVPLVLLSS